MPVTFLPHTIAWLNCSSVRPVALALRIAAERHVADFLAGAPKTADALSMDTGLPAGTLRRLLRGLAALGVFQESADGLFSNSAVSAYMRDGVTPSLREMMLVLNDDAVLKGWQQLPAVMDRANRPLPRRP